MSPLRHRLITTVCLRPIAYRAAQPLEPRGILEMIDEVFVLAAAR